MLRSKISMHLFMISTITWIQQSHLQAALPATNSSSNRFHRLHLHDILFRNPAERRDRLLRFLDQHQEFIDNGHHPVMAASKDETVAHVLAFQRNWDLLEEIIDRYGESCTTQSVGKIRDKEEGTTPLQLLCFITPHNVQDYDIAKSIAAKLLQQRPYLALMSRADGMNAAHACVSKGRLINIGLLLTIAHHCPESIHRTTQNGLSVIDIIVQGQESFLSIKALEFLTAQHVRYLANSFDKCQDSNKLTFLAILTQSLTRHKTPVYQPSNARFDATKDQCICCQEKCYCCLHPESIHQKYWVEWYMKNHTHPHAHEWLTKYQQLHRQSPPPYNLAIVQTPNPPAYCMTPALPTAQQSPPPYPEQ